MSTNEARGISIHIGLNRVDPDAYNGWTGALSGCVNDAELMEDIARELGYETTVLTNEDATATAVIDALTSAANELTDNDILVLTYSGHGGQVDDEDGDEPDAKDETWVLYDRMLIDDELYQSWSAFASGVRIFMLSDSCHSGTVLRAIYTEVPKFEPLARGYGLTPARARALETLPQALRVIPNDVLDGHLREMTSYYVRAKDVAGHAKAADVAASVILISGCQDNQLSLDGAKNGLFTEKLLNVWDEAGFQGDYKSFWSQILAKMPATQSPNFDRTGTPNPGFEAQKPFTIGAAEAAEPAEPAEAVSPSVSGPESMYRDDDPPSFDVVTGDNSYYIFEITSDWSLFAGGDRTSENFYATWDDSNAPARFTDSTYTLSSEAWERLKEADRLWYRIGTTSSEDTWDNYTVSTYDDEGKSAPSIEILAERGRARRRAPRKAVRT